MQRVMRNVKQSVFDLPKSCMERRNVLRAFEHWDKGMDPIARIREALGRPYTDYTFFRRHFMHCGLAIHFMRTLFH